jgi:hypothetical protein
VSSAPTRSVCCFCDTYPFTYTYHNRGFRAINSGRRCERPPTNTRFRALSIPGAQLSLRLVPTSLLAEPTASGSQRSARPSSLIALLARTRARTVDQGLQSAQLPTCFNFTTSALLYRMCPLCCCATKDTRCACVQSVPPRSRTQHNRLQSRQPSRLGNASLKLAHCTASSNALVAIQKAAERPH